MRKTLLLILSIFTIFGLTSCISLKPEYANYWGNVSEYKQKYDTSSSSSSNTSSSTGHVHTYSNYWSYDETTHWKNPTCGHAVVYGFASHVWEEYGNTYRCSVCGYVKDDYVPEDISQHEHVYSSYSSNFYSHWSYCDICGKASSYEQHEFISKIDFGYNKSLFDGKVCQKCGYTDGEYLNSYDLLGISNKNDSNFHAVGGFEGSWGPNDENKMKYTTVDKLYFVDSNLYNYVSGSSYTGIYYAVVKLGSFDAGWTTSALINGDLVSLNGSCTIKAIDAHYDSLTENYITDQWIPDVKTAHVESLTPSTLFISGNWQEESDEYGFDWTSNPVCIGGAGYYYLIVVDYGKTSSTYSYGYGMALVRIKSIDSEYGKSTAVNTNVSDDIYVVDDHTYDVYRFNDNGVQVISMEKYAENIYSATVYLEAGDSFSVYADNRYNYWAENTVNQTGYYTIEIEFDSSMINMDSIYEGGSIYLNR